MPTYSSEPDAPPAAGPAAAAAPAAATPFVAATPPPPPIIVPKIVQLPDTILKEKQLSMFLKKVHLDAAQDFTNKDIKELVTL